jgi:hypothetical protein
VSAAIRGHPRSGASSGVDGTVEGVGASVSFPVWRDAKGGVGMRTVVGGRVRGGSRSR